MNAFLNTLLAYALWPTVIIVVVWLAGRFLKPWLDSNSGRKETARDIAQIADDLSHILVHEFPNSTIDDHVAALIDKLIDKLDLKRQTAEDVALAAALRRKVDGVKFAETITLRDLK